MVFQRLNYLKVLVIFNQHILIPNFYLYIGWDLIYFFILDFLLIHEAQSLTFLIFQTLDKESKGYSWKNPSLMSFYAPLIFINSSFYYNLISNYDLLSSNNLQNN